MQLFCWPYFIIPANHISIDASTYQNIEVSKYRNIEIPKHQKIEVSTPQNIDTSIHRNIEISKHRNIQISKFQCFEISRYRSVDMPIASENEMPIQVHVIDNPLFIDHKKCRFALPHRGDQRSNILQLSLKSGSHYPLHPLSPISHPLWLADDWFEATYTSLQQRWKTPTTIWG